MTVVREKWGKVRISVGGGRVLSCILELDGAFSVDRTRTDPAKAFFWNLVLDDAEVGDMAPASAGVAADGKAVIVDGAAERPRVGWPGRRVGNFPFIPSSPPYFVFYEVNENTALYIYSFMVTSVE